MPSYRIEWLDEARADVRRLDRPAAMRVFEGILHYATNGAGDVSPLHGDMAGSFRLRVGNYRVLVQFFIKAPCGSTASPLLRSLP